MILEDNFRSMLNWTTLYMRTGQAYTPLQSAYIDYKDNIKTVYKDTVLSLFLMYVCMPYPELVQNELPIIATRGLLICGNLWKIQRNQDGLKPTNTVLMCCAI